MAKQIIILNKGTPWPGQISVNYVLWATVPSNLQVKYAQPSTFQSAYADATTAELASLISGATTERVESQNIPVGTTIPVIKGILQDRFVLFQNQVTNDTSWQFYGTFFDGTSWTAGGL